MGRSVQAESVEENGEGPGRRKRRAGLARARSRLRGHAVLAADDHRAAARVRLGCVALGHVRALYWAPICHATTTLAGGCIISAATLTRDAGCELAAGPW